MSASTDNFIVVPLSNIDQNGVHTSSITFGYVVKSVDAEALEAAANRAAKEWRLLAGRVEWNAELKTHQIRVPVAETLPKEYVLTKFTTSKLPSVQIPLANFTEVSAMLIEKPPVKYFRHPSQTNSLSDYASKKAPILSIHISQMANCVCVGLTFPHGLMDATGMGQVVKALNACLNDLPWTPPRLSSTNILREELRRLENSESVGDPCPPGLQNLQRDFSSANVKNILALLVSLATEMLWHRARPAAVYLGPKTAEQLVETVKKQAADEGKDWVSTADIMAAWSLKAAYLEEGPKSNNTMSCSAAVSLRSTLAKKNPDFENYTHNAHLPAVFPPLTVKQVSDMSLYELALIHRKAVDTVRDISYIQGYTKWVPTVDGVAIPVRKWGNDAWLLTNQIIGGVDKLDFGSKVFGFYHYMLPFAPDHVFTINRMRGGYIIEGFSGIRPSRIRGMEKALESIRNGNPLVF